MARQELKCTVEEYGSGHRAFVSVLTKDDAPLKLVIDTGASISIFRREDLVNLACSFKEIIKDPDSMRIAGMILIGSIQKLELLLVSADGSVLFPINVKAFVVDEIRTAGSSNDSKGLMALLNRIIKVAKKKQDLSDQPKLPGILGMHLLTPTSQLRVSRREYLYAKLTLDSEYVE